MSLLRGLLVAVLLTAQPAAAQVLSPLPASMWPGFYAGVGVNQVHHTGYVPKTEWNTEEWVTGGKLFAGYRVNDWAQFEVAYHYFGDSAFYEGNPVLSRERTQALSASFIYVSAPVSQWLIPTYFPTHVLLRIGLAYKNIHHTSVYGTFNEGILSALIGTGIEVRFSPRWFARLEYEFFSTAIGGPPQSVPSLASLFKLTIGGTERAINIMNTAVSLTVGMNL